MRRLLAPVLLASLALGLGLVLPPPAMADLLGVDVSKWQGSVNWNLMKNDGVSFGFARATYGVGGDDERFAQNMAGARAAGIPIGPYHFAYPDTNVGTLADPVKQDAINEANYFVDAIKPYYDNYPGAYLRPVLDMERTPESAEINTIAEQKQYLSDWVRDFNSVVQDRLGLDVIFYTGGYRSKTFYESDIADLDLWFAKPTGSSSVNQPTASNIGIWDDWVFWQYSWEGSLGGESPLDLDVFRGDLNDLQEYVVGGDTTLQGDYNDDGVVNAADYTVWRDTYLAFGDYPADGDGNGVVSGADYTMWAAYYGQFADPESSSAVPEPSTSLLALAAVGLGRRHLKGR